VSSEVRRNIRTDKRNFADRMAQEAEEAAASGNMKQLYDISLQESLDEQSVWLKIRMEVS